MWHRPLTATGTHSVRSGDASCVIHAPWIPARTGDGSIVERGILATLCQAHEIFGISGDLPTQTFALPSLLLAVLHGALRRPKDVDEWDELWPVVMLPADAIEDYLSRHDERFDLFRPQTPFLQTAGLRTAKDETGREIRQQVTTAAHADNRFRRSLEQALPYAYVDAPVSA